MNRSRRERLNTVLVLLQRAELTIDSVRDEEKDSLENMPENLQSSERYVAMENAVDSLEDAIENIHDAAKSIDSAINSR